MLPAIFIICLSQYFSAITDPKVILRKTVMFFPFSIALSYCFIFGKVGFPKLGINGAAYSVVLSYWFLFVWLLKDFFKHKITKRFIKSATFFKKPIKSIQILKLGMPIMLQNSTDFLFLFVITLMIGWFGRGSLAAQQIINQLNMFLFLIPFSLGQGAAILVSQAYGKNDTEEICQIAKLALYSIILFSLIAGAISMLYSHWLIGLYLSKNSPNIEEIKAITMKLLLIFVFFQFFNAIKTVISSILRGLHNTKIPMLVSVVSNWVIGLPVCYLLGVQINMLSIGVNIGYLVSATMASIVMWLFWIMTRNKMLLGARINSLIINKNMREEVC